MYEFYIDNVLLPVPPSKLQTKISNQNKTIQLINDDEVNILKKAGLTEISFDLLIPFAKYPFASYKNGFKNVKYFLDHLEVLKTDMKKFQFIVSRVAPSGELSFDTNMKVSLEDYTIAEDASEGLDVTVSVRLKQYVEYGTKELIIKKDDTGTHVIISVKKRTSKKNAKTYKVKKGDTLWGICKKELGNGSKFAAIAKLNKIKNANLIFVGQVIKLE